ncbi:DUF3945 domain-containing protein [Pedobacter sp. Leaf170]|uniref:DUF3945 domain-containing protein n=1 Tax=Pedobacter sp. Leaf170 TaxID=2876558 RepID=UPI001E3F4AE9|nr:DUF3945 domain-containing protein [Pedobacter sp. Leaf170]
MPDKVLSIRQALRIEAKKSRVIIYVEYDKLTKDFVGYDVSKVQAPDRINGMLLSEEDKSAFKRGNLLELADGTKIQHRASEPKGIISDRKALVLSVLIDGGISYLLLRGIRSLSENVDQKDHLTPAFNSALAEMEGVKVSRQREFGMPELPVESTMRKVGR